VKGYDWVFSLSLDNTHSQIDRAGSILFIPLGQLAVVVVVVVVVACVVP
jgi:hypothetical protein